jgi:tetratricopeptide (TPR) repeat protein
MALDPLNELLAINYAGNLYVRGDYGAARELLDGLVRVRPDSATLLRTLAGYAFGHGDLVEAWEYAQRSYLLEPESPAVIQTMARAWMELGELERAETILRKGLELAGDNADLNTQYFQLMLVAGRLEEAERVVQEQYGNDFATLPERFQRFYHFQMGLIDAVRGDLLAAREQLELAIDPDLRAGFDGDQLFTLTMVSFLSDQLGDAERADQRLAEAERAVRRARINGIDDAGIYYTEAILHILRDETGEAIRSLQTAYDRGWRQSWLLELDGRLDPLRNEPGFLAIRDRIAEDISRARATVLSQPVAMR